MEERDDVSLVSTVSSVRKDNNFITIIITIQVGEDDNYLSEPTYNNLDPLWARRHGFGPGWWMVCAQACLVGDLCFFFNVLQFFKGKLTNVRYI